jgi:hypothetical protein
VSPSEHRWPRGRVGRAVAVAILTGGLAAAAAPVVAALGPAAASSTGQRRAPRSAAPAPATMASARLGILPPGDPSQNVQPPPNLEPSCVGTSYVDSPSCISAALAAIDGARALEGLPGMVLPTDWTELTPEQQLFTATNLERTARGLPPLSGMATALDQASASAAAGSTDPSPPGGFPWRSWGGNWAGNVGNPLEAIFFWMYDDGSGSANIDCTSENTSGCWGHRNNILLSLACTPCDMGTGFDPTAWQGDPSWTELLVDTDGHPALDFSWSQVLAYLPGSPSAASNPSPLAARAVGIASTPDGQGYWLVASDGGVFAFGNAGFYGSMGGRPLSKPVVGIASTPDGQGYWLVASDGGIFAFGDAGFYGSVGGRPLSKPVVGIASAPDGQGYWEVASDGGIFSFGDAGFHGSMGGRRLAKQVVGMAPTHDGLGYWLVASDGGVFAFGDAPFYGSMGGTALFRPVVSVVATPDGGGYWMTASDGGIFAFGDAGFRGSTGGQALNAPVVSMTASSDAGYWLAASDGGIFSFGVPFHGSMG